MDIFLERCAGLDVHQASVVCCVLIGAPERKPQKLLRSFGTTTLDLETLRAWLVEKPKAGHKPNALQQPL